MNESSRSKGVKNVLSLQVARERTRQAKAASDRQISKRSNQRLLERLEAENAQLRDCVMQLMLEIQALHDGFGPSRRKRLSLGSLFEVNLLKKQIGHQSPQP
jgi:hypothetical protein